MTNTDKETPLIELIEQNPYCPPAVEVGPNAEPHRQTPRYDVNRISSNMIDKLGGDKIRDKQNKLGRCPSLSMVAEMFPAVITERLDDDGNPVPAIDLDLLRQELSDHVVEGPHERYQLNWPGKREALFAANAPIAKTLRPVRDESVDFDTTQNLFVEGDNLEVLKILQKHYHGKIKMIYVDPPYNTGKDFIYPDNYREGLATYLEWTRQVNEEGKKVSTNSESDGRYHSNWLNMMYPRLRLARNLLSDDGAIFISIDDHEVDNLQKLCKEIFGEDNVETIIWHKVGDDSGRLKITHRVRREHEYILVCYRNIRKVFFKKYLSERNYKNTYTNPDNDPRGVYKQGIVSHTEEKSRPGGKNYYSVTTPSGKVFTRQWRVPEEEFAELHKDGRIYYGKKGDSVPSLKVFIDELGETTPTTIFAGLGTAKSAGLALIELFGGNKYFDYPKPVELIQRMIAIATESDDIVLDFFAGSGTTAHAVLAQNAADGGTRQFIAVQLPEPTEVDSEARRAGFDSIAAIARRRVDLAGSAIASGIGGDTVDVGYRCYQLVDTNFSKWRVASDIEPTELEQRLLDLRESSDDDASSEALLTELLLKQGYSLTEESTELEVAGLTVRSVGGGLLLAYLDERRKPTLDQLRQVVDLEPARVVILEDAFQGDDELKTNLAQLTKSKGIELWTA